MEDMHKYRYICVYLCVYTLIYMYMFVCVYIHLDLANVFASSLPFFWLLLTPNDIITISLDLASIEKCEPLLTVVKFQGCIHLNFK